MPNSETTATRVENMKLFADQLARSRAEEPVPQRHGVEGNIGGIAANALRELRARTEMQPAGTEQKIREFLAYTRSELQRSGVAGEDADRIFDEIVVRCLTGADKGQGDNE